MKLKWRIFLISLALIMVSVAATAISVLQISFNSSVKTEREGAAAYHSYFSSSVTSRIMYLRMIGSVAVLEEERTLSILTEMALDYESYGKADAVMIADKEKKTKSLGGHTELFDLSRLPAQKDLGQDACSCIIYDVGDATVLQGASLIDINGEEHYLISAVDISEVYSEFDSLFETVGAISIAFALFISLILFIFTALILQPVSSLNNSLERITKGDYSSRVSEKGSTEIQSIAKNINTMASAVEEKVLQLENIAEGRKRYVDSLAHEMKTPLTSILGYGDLLRLKREVSAEERVEYSQVIVDEAKRLKALSSKLLELACADSAELELKPLFVKELFCELSAALVPVFEKNGIMLKIEKNRGVINADRELFFSLLLNLCDNARKASKEGNTVLLSSDISDGKVIITVCDTGIGMSEQTLARVTEPFFMADKSRSRKAGGAGLGLSLCAEIARRNGATMEIKSTLGEGTVVTVTLSESKGVKDEN